MSCLTLNEVKSQGHVSSTESKEIEGWLQYVQWDNSFSPTQTKWFEGRYKYITGNLSQEKLTLQELYTESRKRKETCSSKATS